MSRVGIFLALIRFEHTLFALPYALAGTLIAAGGRPGWRVFGLVIVAMVGARTAAMSFNRLVDRRIDAANPRTARRASATGAVSAAVLAAATAASAAIFCLAAWLLNDLAFVLSFPTLAVLLAYSYTKRFLHATHYVLGVALGLSPPGAWVAVRGTLEGSAPAWALGLAVTVWTAGFDILYACQDRDFDRKHGLHSVPVWLGMRRAMGVARLSHALVPLSLVLAGRLAGLGPAYYSAVAVVAVLLVYEHAIVSDDDLSRINRAFFTVNAVIGLLVLAGVVVDLLVTNGSA